MVPLPFQTSDFEQSIHDRNILSGKTHTVSRALRIHRLIVSLVIPSHREALLVLGPELCTFVAHLLRRTDRSLPRKGYRLKERRF